jgi:broad specificity phosphatase PhoE
MAGMTGSPPDPGDRERPRLWVVRHGETPWSAAGRHTGWTDIELTEAGRDQARTLGPRLAGLPFDAVVSSPLSRALETARIAGFAGRVTTDEDLREWDYGTDEGRTTAEIRADRPGWSIWRDGVIDGESIAEVAARADRVIDRARALPGDTLCFAHGHVLRVLAARWVGLGPFEGSRFELATATISILGWERETPVIGRWNDGLDLD